MTRSGQAGDGVSTAAQRSAVFLDRDGVLVVPEFRDGRSYAPTAIEGFQLYPGIAACLSALKEAGFDLVVVTNQPDVGRGIIPRETLDAMHAILRSALPLDEIRVCPHTREDRCGCRKPEAGMLTAVARERNIALASSYMVGDRDSDIEAGKRAGCRTIFINLKYAAEPRPIDPDWSVASLQEAAAIILNQTGARIR